MPEHDAIKAQIANLHIWLGVMIVSDASLIGWLAINAYSASHWLIAACTLTIVGVTVGVGYLQGRLRRLIARLREL